MQRIVSVWFPLWPIERMKLDTLSNPDTQQQPSEVFARKPSVSLPSAPFALVESGRHGLILSALDDRARREGLYPGQALADARAAVPRLFTRPGEPNRDRAALKALTLWCGRYGPRRNCHGHHGGVHGLPHGLDTPNDSNRGQALDSLWIDVTGVAHLFGGEARLMADLASRLASFGFTASIGLADTFGAAFAAARFLGAGKECNNPTHIIPRQGAKAAMSALPVDALRLPAECVVLLKRLGLRRVGQLYDLPREALAQRFRTSPKPSSKSTTATSKREREMMKLAGAVLVRLDQALGAAFEILLPIEDPPALVVRQTFVEPLISTEGIVASTTMLATALCRRLDDSGQGGTRFTLELYRTDGTSATVGIGVGRPCRQPTHLLALLAEKFTTINAGFGIDVMTLAAVAVEKIGIRQTVLPTPGIEAIPAEASPLIDRLSNRLGADRVLRLVAADSHCPERAQQRHSALSSTARSAPPWRTTSYTRRPPFLLTLPEPVIVTAEAPEGPPLRFIWRRLARRILRAEGPERIEPEWWRPIVQHNLRQHRSNLDCSSADRPRDYYLVEASGGGRYWIFRAGLYGSDSDAPPAWFLHGVFG